MYVGLQKAPSYDRPNGRMDRVWHGPGSIVTGIPLVQAANLLRHEDEWADVTKLEEAARQTKAQAVLAQTEETLRTMKHQPIAPGATVGVASMSDEDLEAELERRKQAREAIAAGEAVETKADPAATRDTGTQSNAETQQLILSAMEAVATEASEDENRVEELLDEEGVPKIGAVIEKLGFSITEDEYRLALGAEA